MNTRVALSSSELAALRDALNPDGQRGPYTADRLHLIRLGLLRATPCGVQLTRAGALRLTIDRFLSDKRRMTVAGRTLH